MAYIAINVPVLPNPALQCTATPPFSFSTKSKKWSIISSDGVEPSKKYKSETKKLTHNKSYNIRRNKQNERDIKKE